MNLNKNKISSLIKTKAEFEKKLEILLKKNNTSKTTRNKISKIGKKI